MFAPVVFCSPQKVRKSKSSVFFSWRQPVFSRPFIRQLAFLQYLHTYWIGLSSVLRPRQHSIGYMGIGFYRSKDPTNSIKVLKEQIVHRQIKHTISRQEHKTQQVP